MFELTFQQNFLSYVGVFRDPPLDLWFVSGGAIFPGLHRALAPFGASIEEATIDSASSRPAEQALVFNFGSQAQYRFSVGRVKADLSQFDESAALKFPEMIASAEAWLRAASEETSFSSHMYSYSLHSEVVDNTSSDVLQNLSDLHPAILGTNRGTGLTFHANHEDGSLIQLSLDHSLAVPDGIYLQYVWTSTEDTIDHVAEVQANRERLEAALETLDLTIVGG